VLEVCQSGKAIGLEDRAGEVVPEAPVEQPTVGVPNNLAARGRREAVEALAVEAAQVELLLRRLEEPADARLDRPGPGFARVDVHPYISNTAEVPLSPHARAIGRVAGDREKLIVRRGDAAGKLDARLRLVFALATSLRAEGRKRKRRRYAQAQRTNRIPRSVPIRAKIKVRVVPKLKRRARVKLVITDAIPRPLRVFTVGEPGLVLTKRRGREQRREQGRDQGASDLH